MTNRTPPELHIVSGKVQAHDGTTLPERVRNRVPQAEWFDDPDLWDANQFIAEASAFLWEVYGIGADIHKHTLAACAAQLDIYVKATKGIRDTGLTIVTEAGVVRKSPYLDIGEKALLRANALMNELGLTPRGQLNSTKQQAGKFADLIAGPLATYKRELK